MYFNVYRHWRRWSLLLGLCSVFFSPLSLAQVNTAAVVGILTDPSGGSVSGANIQMKNVNSGATFHAESDSRGEYTFDRLVPGEYNLEILASGFQSLHRNGIRLDATQRIKLDVVLQLGNTAQTITVDDGAPLLNTQNTELGSVVNEIQVRNLPLNGRNFSQLISLQPGAVKSGGGVYFNGLTRDGITVNIDGTDASNPDRPSTEDFGGQTRQNLLSVEFISEFKTTSGVFSAETGRAMSGAVNVITKSGTNQFHGTSYEFFRNDKMDARNFFGTERDKLRLNQFGATLGGPILKNKLFFFGGWEAARERRGTQISGFVFSDALRDRIRAGNPALNPLLDTIAPVTETTSDPNRSFHRRSDVNSNREDSFQGRLDYRPGDKDQLFVRYTLLDSDSVAPELSPKNALTYPSQNRSGTVSWTRIVTSRAVNEFRGGINKQDLPRTSGAFSPRGIPQISGVFSTGLPKMLRSNGGSWTIANNFSYNAGRHSFRMGFERQRFHHGRSEYQNPIYTVDAVDDLITGKFRSVLMTPGYETKRIQQSNWGFFLQDDWRISPRLTLNMGLRYEYFTSPTERDGSLYNVVADAAGPWRPKGTPIFNGDKNNFAPRFGLAWDMGGDGKNVIRAGSGFYYAPNAFREITALVGAPDRPSRITIVGSQGDFHMPLDEAAIMNDLSNFPLPVDRTIYDPFARTSYSIQWMFNYQRLIMRNLTAEIGYVGNRGLKLHDVNLMNNILPSTGNRPNTSIGQIRQQENSDMSTYHGLQTSLRRRFAHGMQLNAHYTWAKNLVVGGVDSFTSTSNSVMQDHQNRRASRGRSGQDIRHVFSLDYTTDLPFDRWSGAKGATKALIGGWQMMGIASIRTGTPMYIRSGQDNYGNSIAGSQRPDVVAGAQSILDGYRDSADHRYLSPQAFADPCTSRGLKRPCGIFGNLGKNVLSGPGAWNFDLSLFKENQIGERMRLQFRTEFFNVFNHANFNNPSELQLSNSNFGRITSASGAREIQLALKVIF